MTVSVASLDTLEAWRDYFDQRITLTIPERNTASNNLNQFNVYIGGSVHNHVLLCLHGAGHTALSWSLVARLVKHCFCVVAYDCRGHGLTICEKNDDFSTETLVDDGLQVISKIRDWVAEQRRVTPKPLTSPMRHTANSHLSPSEILVRERILANSKKNGIPIILMGHSMGGAMAIHLAATQQIPNLQGLIVLDVVEGTALEALPMMDRFIQTFPESFNSIQDAVEWALRNVLNNRESAVVSIPSQLYYDGDVWRWRVNLKATKPFWKDWFMNTGDKFLNTTLASGGKVLVLVGHERLDKSLTIAQMQGKFQLTVIPKSGHIVEEDQPEDLKDVLLRFAERYCLL